MMRRRHVWSDTDSFHRVQRVERATVLFFSDASDVITVHGHYLPALPLVWPKYADFFLMLQAGNF